MTQNPTPIQSPSQSSQYTPSNPAEQPAAARRCSCGQPAIPPPDHSGKCLRCRRAYMIRYRSVRAMVDPTFRTKIRLVERRNAANRHARLRDQATARYQRWSPAEENLLLNPDITHAEAAALLKRSWDAVVTRRNRLAQRYALAETIRGHAKAVRKHFPSEHSIGEVAS